MRTSAFLNCVSFAHIIAGRVSTDGDNTARTTNLAIKGIIALKSFAEIGRILGQDADADTYEVYDFGYCPIVDDAKHNSLMVCRTRHLCL